MTMQLTKKLLLCQGPQFVKVFYAFVMNFLLMPIHGVCVELLDWSTNIIKMLIYTVSVKLWPLKVYR